MYKGHLRQCIVLFVVADGWLLLDIGCFVLFLNCLLHHAFWHQLALILFRFTISI